MGLTLTVTSIILHTRKTHENKEKVDEIDALVLDVFCEKYSQGKLNNGNAFQMDWESVNMFNTGTFYHIIKDKCWHKAWPQSSM